MPHELSGGEQQRVVIARALVNTPSILLADEPTGNLDPVASAEIMELIRKINMRGTAVLMATHNYELVRKYPARVIQLKDGKLVDIEIK
jgi:cell division transport system ATP-binding protein